MQINTKFYDNQRQLRNRIISGINKKLYEFFENKDFICRSSDTEDKQMMDYYINRNLKQKDIEKLKNYS